MRLFPISAMILVSACSAAPEWEKPATQTISCADYYAEKTTKGTLYNNVWNKKAANDFSWSQCLEKDPATGMSGWSWRWPANWSDVSGANHNQWIYVTFRAKNKNLKSKFDVVKLTQYAIAKQILPANFYFADIELGTDLDKRF